MSREVPKPGEKWRHFKGNEYVVIAIAYYLALGDKYVIYTSSLDTEIWLPDSPIYDTESNQIFYVSGLQLSDGSENMPLHLSNATQTSRTKTTGAIFWARPLDNFMAVLSSGEDEHASNYYRFERSQ